MMIGMLRGIIISIIMTQMGLVRRFVMLNVAGSTGTCGCIVSLVVETAIRVHDHATDFV